MNLKREIDDLEKQAPDLSKLESELASISSQIVQTDKSTHILTLTPIANKSLIFKLHSLLNSSQHADPLISGAKQPKVEKTDEEELDEYV